ncbi:amino acid ABC transporter permease [Sutterella sp.]|uniref:amino acid ABC transporter permease n=1 Tax=Sutterella sp. TaxID=1981025 RepID=UPI0025CBC5A6|nr:amino acid ABC transporter permease [uncultured Sutterella sp.]
MLDYAFIDKFLPLYVEGALLTIRVGVAGILLAFAVGLFCAVVKSLRVPGLTGLVGVYGELSRNTPLLVQLFFLYFGLPKIGIRLSGEWCAIIGLAFLGGSYMAEALRSGLEAVPKIQSESARVLGLSGWQTMRFVVLPQALAVALPALVANVIFLVKEVSVVSAIALPDLMYVAKDLIGNYYRTDESLLLLVAAYVLLLLPVSLLGTHLEKRLRHAGFGNLRSV